MKFVYKPSFVREKFCYELYMTLGLNIFALDEDYIIIRCNRYIPVSDPDPVKKIPDPELEGQKSPDPIWSETSPLDYIDPLLPEENL